MTTTMRFISTLFLLAILAAATPSLTSAQREAPSATPEAPSLGVESLQTGPSMAAPASVSDFSLPGLMAAGTEFTFTVSMRDGDVIPYGSSWSLIDIDDNHSIIATGVIPQGVMSWTYTIPVLAPNGVYTGLEISGPYWSNFTGFTTDGTPFHYVTELSRQFGDLLVTLDTTDDGAIPAGTTWRLLDGGGDPIDSGTLTAPLPDGSPLPLANPLEMGPPYTVTITAPGYLPFTGEVVDHQLTALLEPAPATVSEVAFSVRMADAGPLPYGLEWMLVASGSGDPLHAGTVPPGDPFWSHTLPATLPFGLYELWITGNGYSSGQVINISEPTTTHDVVLDRLVGNLTVTVDTSGAGDVPAGTTWSVTDVAGNTIDGGTLTQALSTGGLLPLSTGFEFGRYTLTIEAPGYHLYNEEIAITNPWATEYAVTALLIAPEPPPPTVTPAPTETPVSTETPAPTASPIPTATPAPAVTPTMTPSPQAEPTAPPAVTALPKTGQGPSSDMSTGTLLVAVAATMALIAARSALAYQQRRTTR